jgi:hypothetical protein
MLKNPPSARGYILAGSLAALAGGLLAALAAKALLRRLSRRLAEMMSQMPEFTLGQMQKLGCNPTEMCQQMSRLFAEASASEETEPAQDGCA